MEFNVSCAPVHSGLLIGQLFYRPVFASLALLRKFLINRLNKVAETLVNKYVTRIMNEESGYISVNVIYFRYLRIYYRHNSHINLFYFNIFTTTFCKFIDATVQYLDGTRELMQTKVSKTTRNDKFQHPKFQRDYLRALNL